MHILKVWFIAASDLMPEVNARELILLSQYKISLLNDSHSLKTCCEHCIKE